MERERFEYIRDGIEDMELDALWDHALAESDVFEDQREFFFVVLEMLVREGIVRLVHMHARRPMPGTLEQQINAYRYAFPKNSNEMNGGIWFFSEECPGGALWQKI